VTITTALIINQVINRNGSSAERVLISPVCHFLLPEDAEPDTQALETFIKDRRDEGN
jgi:hypothetical protein